MKFIPLFLLLALLTGSPAEANQIEKQGIQTFASAETKTWEDYYQKNQAALVEDITHLISMQYQVSQLQVLEEVTPKIALAALRFKNLPSSTTPKEYEAKVLPLLTSAYRNLKEIVHASWDPAKVAKADLDWWIFRRQADKHDPEIVAKRMNDLFQLVFGSEDQQHFIRAAYLRATAARYRDLSALSWGGMSPSDWQVVQNLLVQFYQELSRGITANENARQN